MPKQVVRETLLVQRRQISAAKRRQLSSAAQAHLIGSVLFKRAGCLALYSPVHGEVATEDLFCAARNAGKTVCYPRVDGERMGFFEVSDLATLTRGVFGLMEPQPGRRIPVSELDLMVVPGVAFDRNGHRLGYGKGFYDRELHAVGFSGVLVGLCYEFQLLLRLPSQSHDIPMDCLVTEQGLFSPLRSEKADGSR